MSNINGFFVPGSIKGSYVANKKNEQGSDKYDAEAISVGMQTQAALQDLEKSYETTINKAYNSYLANKQAIGTSMMGQGYKELYEEAERENLLAQKEQAATNVSQVKAQLLSQEQQAQSVIQQQYQAEVANLDRVARSMSDYLNYVRSLEGGIDYLSQLSGTTVTNETLAEDLYEALFNAQPQALSSAEDADIKGMSYNEWLHSKMEDTDTDRAFEQWLYSGGLYDFKKSANITEETDFQKAQAERQKEYNEYQAEQKAKEEAEKLNNPNYQGYIASGGNYSTVKGGVVQMDSKTSVNISNALDTESKLDSGEWKKGDIIKYNGRYYQIVDVRAKWNRRGKVGHVSYKEINY